MYNNILVPLDGSKRAESILGPVKNLAQQHKSRVTFLQVEEPPMMLGYDEVIDVNTYRKGRKKRKKRVTHYLTYLMQEFKERGIEAEFKIAYGSVVESILNTAEDTNCDLICNSILSQPRLLLYDSSGLYSRAPAYPLRLPEPTAAWWDNPTSRRAARRS